MSKTGITRILPARLLLFTVSFLLLALGLYWHNQSPAQPDDGLDVQDIIASKIRYYNEHYPDIKFVHIDGGKDWHHDLSEVMIMLGDKPIAMDYDHPPELRKDLIEVSIIRLRRMLQDGIVSSTLFMSGENSLIEQSFLCTITLKPDIFVADDATATQYMLDLPDDVIEKVHPSRHLDHRHHLEFTLDHEAFHCLDSYMHGGIPMSEKSFGSHYYLFRRESVADAYAMAKHIHDNGAITRYARNMTHFRAMSLFTGPNHYTFETTREVLRQDPKVLQAMSDDELINFALNLRNQKVRPYQEYLAVRAATLKAAKILGVDIGNYGEDWCQCENIETTAEQVNFLVNRYRYYYEQLFTDETVPLEAPALSAAGQNKHPQ
jgi:hypothetical protein